MYELTTDIMYKLIELEVSNIVEDSRTMADMFNEWQKENPKAEIIKMNSHVIRNPGLFIDRIYILYKI